MPNEPKKQPKNLPTYEEIERELGLDMMSFFSDMVRPDQHEERDDEGLPDRTSRSVELTPEHQRAVIEHLESELGRKLTQQELTWP